VARAGSGMPARAANPGAGLRSRSRWLQALDAGDGQLGGVLGHRFGVARISQQLPAGPCSVNRQSLPVSAGAIAAAAAVSVDLEIVGPLPGCVPGQQQRRAASESADRLSGGKHATNSEPAPTSARGAAAAHGGRVGGWRRPTRRDRRFGLVSA